MSNNEIFSPTPLVGIANRHPFTAGESWGVRASLDCQWICVLSGNLVYRRAGQRPLEVNSGDLLFIPAQELHELRAPADGSLAGFHGEWYNQGRWADGDHTLPVPWRRVTHMPSSARVAETMTRMARLFVSFPPFKAQRLSCLAADVLLQLAAEWQLQTQPGISPRTRAMLSWIRSCMPLTVDRNAIAEHFDLTPAYVNQLFKKELGLSPGAVVRRERCAVAYQLLQKGQTVTETADLLGFADPFHFSRVFSKVYGISPSQARP